MNNTSKLDLSQLYGFDNLNIKAGEVVDFRNASASALMGAKVGRTGVGSGGSGAAGGEITLEDAPALKKFA